MQKNYFMKNVLAAMMLLALSMGMSSCTGLVDAVLGTSDNPTTQPTTQPEQPKATVVTVTDEGAKVEASNAAEVSQALESLVDDIKEKGVGEGKVYVLEVSSDALSVEDIQTITVPEIEDATINIVIKEPFKKSVTLKFTSNTTAATRGMASTRGEEPETSDAMSITLPETDGEHVPTFEFSRPNTDVSMYSEKGNSYINIKDVNEGSIGSAVLYLNKGVGVDTYFYTPKKEKEKLFIWMHYFDYMDLENEVYRTIEQRDYEAGAGEDMIMKHLKINKTDVTAHVDFTVNYVDKVTIADGVTVVSTNRNGKVGPLAWDIESEGKSTLILQGEANLNNYNPKKDNYCSTYAMNLAANRYKGITFIPEISNVDGLEDGVEVRTEVGQVPANMEDCTFNTDGVVFENFYKRVDKVYVKNTKFVSTARKSTPSIVIWGERQTEDITSYEVTFDGCEFTKNTCFFTYLNNWQWDSNGNSVELTYSDYSFTVNLNNCTIGGEKLTADNFILGGYNNFDGVKYIFVIDGKKYKLDGLNLVEA